MDLQSLIAFFLFIPALSLLCVGLRRRLQRPVDALHEAVIGAGLVLDFLQITVLVGRLCHVFQR